MAEPKKDSEESGEKKKKTFGQKFMNFLAMGGFIVILFVVVGIFIFISWLTN